MTFYDDAEFAAINMVRLAAAEDDGDQRTAAMHGVVIDMYERHETPGVSGLCMALARQYSAALRVIAAARGTSIAAIIDEFEQHKLGQIDDEPEPDA